MFDHWDKICYSLETIITKKIKPNSWIADLQRKLQRSKPNPTALSFTVNWSLLLAIVEEYTTKTRYTNCKPETTTNCV